MKQYPKTSSLFANYLGWEIINDLASGVTHYQVPEHLPFRVDDGIMCPVDMRFHDQEAWLAEVIIKSNKEAKLHGYQLSYAIGTNNGNEYRIEKIDEQDVFDCDSAAWMHLLEHNSTLSKVMLELIQVLNPSEYEQIIAFKS